MSNRDGQFAEAFEILDLLLNGLAIHFREGLGWGLFLPFICDFVDRLEVFFQRWLIEFKALAIDKDDEAKSLRRTSVIRDCLLYESACRLSRRR